MRTYEQLVTNQVRLFWRKIWEWNWIDNIEEGYQRLEKSPKAIIHPASLRATLKKYSIGKRRILGFKIYVNLRQTGS